MASRKKQKRSAESDSDSDSGPEDREPQPQKKSKAQTRNDNEDEPSWPLDKKRFLKVREFKGRLMIDIREYYDAGGELKPGKKGISLSTQQWRKLVDIAKEVDEAIERKA